MTDTTAPKAPRGFALGRFWNQTEAARAALDVSWHARAACNGVMADPQRRPEQDPFHLDDTSYDEGSRPRVKAKVQEDRGKRWCALCPVSAECLRSVLIAESQDPKKRAGVWGGTGPEERDEIVDADYARYLTEADLLEAS